MQLIIQEIVNIRFMIKNTKYGVTKCGRVFNIETRKELNRKVVSGCYGYYINGKFKTLDNIRPELEKINKVKLPF